MCKHNTPRIAFIGLVISIIAISFVSLRTADTYAERRHHFEIWAVDQGTGPGTLYIYNGEDMDEDAASAVPEVYDLNANVAPLCVAQTGTAPVRGHMLGLNSTHSHVILAFVASGHVVFFNTATRLPVKCIDVGVQAHAAFASPDDRHVFVANQNGKQFHRIATDYATETFTLDDAATLDLATCTTPNGFPCQDAILRPDTAPICPLSDSSGRFVFVTLRGGGMLVLDGKTTPMSIVAEYDAAHVNGNGCAGFQSRDLMYINSGGGTGVNPTEEDLYSFRVSDFPIVGFNPPNMPAPHVLLDQDGDSHGSVLMRRRHGRYLWVADRLDNEVAVIDTFTDVWVNTFSLLSRHSGDPTPDLMDVSPDGKFVYTALRGPCPVSGNEPSVNNSVGTTPGVGVIKVQRSGFKGEMIAIAPISNPVAPFVCTSVGVPPTLAERADIHTLRVVIK
ncbi:MAG: lactonase family protein [Acidobacteriota bacterium]|nr:lactonase family protein [Acidobacteriota bacterium]